MRDKEIPNVVAKNETIVDDLGKIEVILSDKTGTITQNIMVMDKICIDDKTYTKLEFSILVKY